ncbi:MAG: hypothetical protein ACKVI6_03220 [Candidatus Poseidoniales archaeon]|jgi:hypothetical protein|tara:strand:+ start:282 stop:1022 length:741 start_codon:yes stop_codon:yes gene_type:complete
MEERSTLISVALTIFPLMCLIALRIILPTFDEVLSNDLKSELIAYLFVLLLGLLVVSRYRVIEDHEYHRSKAIRKLSKSYKLEDRGLWEDSGKVLSKLEMNAKINSNNKNSLKINTLMKGNIGAINKERNEEIIENIITNNGESLGLLEDDKATIAEKKSLLNYLKKIPGIFNQMIDKAAINKINKNIKKQKNIIQHKKHEKISLEDEKWSASPSKSFSNILVCNSCKSLNNEGISYCTSCGDYLP